MHRRDSWSYPIAVAVAVMALPAAGADNTAAPNDSDSDRQVSQLVHQLNDDAATQRDAAEARLLELAGTNAATSDHFLSLLPPDSDQLPLAVRDRLTRIRKQVEDRAAKSAVAPTSVTLSAKQMPVFDVFSAIEKQTGNQIVDHRQQAGEEDRAKQQKLDVAFQNEPFWSAVDKVLDQAQLGVYAYAGADALAIVEREPGDGLRHEGAVYSGPFRLEILEVTAQHNLRKPDSKSLKLSLEVAWEPRLRPLAVSQAAAEVVATDDAGHKLELSQPDAVLDAEIPVGTQATELVLPLALPARDVAKIASLKGKLRALVPGRQVKFQFDDLAHAAGKTQTSGGVQVTIDAIRKNNEVWEIHMRLRLDEDNHALESHRGWAFQNLSYLVDKDGKRIESAGLETTLQTKNEVGVAYFFDAPKGLDGLTWVYETPAAIVELPIEYEFKDIPLP
ncbi:MAG TPA: hypothetical protein VGM76_14075 [Lacipirellulaceae bacterium]|jgi:hypothetical protein